LKAGFSKSVSARAFKHRTPMAKSFAQEGTNPHRKVDSSIPSAPWRNTAALSVGRIKPCGTEEMTIRRRPTLA
jgi:hypothetical protein